MPKPIPKTEQDLREAEIADVVRAEVNLAVASYRRRMLNILPDLIDEYRATADQGVLEPINASYRSKVRSLIRGYETKALGSGRV